MVSFDVVSLFPSIPVDLALKIIEEKWCKLEKYTSMTKTLFMKIVKFCIKDNRFFKYKDKIFQQKKGLPMGSPASPVVADIVMEKLLDESIKDCDIRPKILTKYVDDLFGIIKNSAISTLMTKFNSFNSNIQFTLEQEENGKLAYLDTMLIRTGNAISMDWYQKTTASGRLVNFHSKHPTGIIMNTATNFIKRVLSISDTQYHENNISRIYQILRQNSFPSKTIQHLIKKYNCYKHIVQTNKYMEPVIFKSMIYIPKLSERFDKSDFIDKSKYKIAPKTNGTIQKLFSNLKSKLDDMEKSNLIYQINCTGNHIEKCDKYYIGTTGNKLKTRLTGHKSDLKLRHNKEIQRTALTTHCAQQHHYPDLERVRVIQCERNYNKRLTLETLHILNTPTKKRINYKTDTDNIGQSYKFLIRKINRVNVEQ